MHKNYLVELNLEKHLLSHSESIWLQIPSKDSGFDSGIHIYVYVYILKSLYKSYYMCIYVNFYGYILGERILNFTGPP